MNVELITIFIRESMIVLPSLLLFILAFVFSVTLTPKVSAVAERFDLLDRPSARKVHSLAIPRIGGVAIFISFFLSIGFGALFSDIQAPLFTNSKVVFVYVGGVMAFCLGFYDDLKQLGPKFKFAIQIVAALFAYAGGLQIQKIALPIVGPIHFEMLSLPVTVLWVLLVINAINLIDGLDGLAAGVSFFVCIVLSILCLIHGNIMVSIILASLAGSILGFLVFNFNPASIFMGDSGSYFIGYMLASLSILGSLKSHTTFTFLIPIIVLGLPILDTVWATTRRFILGQKLFHPDKNHFHHKLMSLGYSHRRAVLLLYAVTIFLGFVSFLMINVGDNIVASILVLLIFLVMFTIRRLGYLNFLGVRNVFVWLNDITNTIGINRDRRMFFAYQLALTEAPSIETLMERVAETAKFLGLDYIEFRLGGQDGNFKKFDDYIWNTQEVGDCKEELFSCCRLYMRFPLEFKGQHYGVMIVSKKNFDSESAHSQTLWRLEFLRRTLATALHSFKQNPEHELCNRRVKEIGNRRMNTLKEELISQMEDKRVNGGDRRILSPA